MVCTRCFRIGISRLTVSCSRGRTRLRTHSDDLHSGATSRLAQRLVLRQSHPRAPRPVDILHDCVYLGCKLRAHHSRLYKVTTYGRACRCARFVQQGLGHPGLQPAQVPNGPHHLRKGPGTEDLGCHHLRRRKEEAWDRIVRRSGAVDLAAICSVYISMGFQWI